MDFELSEEQQLLKQTCERYFADHYQFESRQRYAHEPRGWSLICWKQYAELGLLGAAVRRRLWRHRRRTGRDHDRDGADRTRVVARALSGHGGARRRLHRARRFGRTAYRNFAEDRRGRTEPCLRARRTAGALRPCRRCNYRAARRRRLRPRRRQDAGAARRHGGKVRRLGAPRRRAKPTATAWRCSWSTPPRPACRCAAIRRSMACAPPR